MDKTPNELRAIARADNELFNRIGAAWSYLRDQTKNHLVTIAEAEAMDEPEYAEENA